MLAIGCYLPIPKTYVLNTREREYQTLYDRSLSVGRINITLWSPDLADRRLQVLEGPRAVSHLSVIRARYSESEGSASHDVVIIHDGVQALELRGAATEFEAELLEACLANPAPR